MKANGDGARALTDNDVPDDEPGWSPDGKFLVFLSQRDGDQDVFRMRSSDGKRQRNLTRNSAHDFFLD